MTSSPDWTAVGAVDYVSAAQRAVSAHHAGRLDEAVEWYRRALSFRPGAADVYNNLAAALMTLNALDDAEDAYRSALSIRPTYGRANLGMATLLAGRGRHRAAIPFYQAAVAADPSQEGGVRFNMGSAYQTIGMAAEAAEAFKNAMESVVRPDQGWSQYLLCLNMLADVAPERVFAEHLRYGARFAPPSDAHDNDPSPERKLRVAYVSVDFRRHLGGRFLLPLYVHHDRSRFEIIAYCGLPAGGEDEYTRWFRQNSDRWVDIGDMSDDALEARIRADRIDVLVDLAGHSGLNRLPALARKPAPVQATWLGYANTTGLKAFDARFVCDATDPAPAADALATEPLVRLPHSFFAFAPPIGAPPTVPPPCWTRGRVVFGSFNFLGKITDRVVALWAEILTRTPDSQLYLKDRALESDDNRAAVAARFEACGVAADRLRYGGYIQDPAGHLAAFADVDIALDPFPYNGTITSIDALWMGVPLVTKTGDRHAARVGAMLMKAVGLDDLIAGNDAEYVDAAVRLANDLPRLAWLRAGMRARLEASPLCDVAGFTRRLEDVYRDLWRDWCARKTSGKTAA